MKTIDEQVEDYLNEGIEQRLSERDEEDAYAKAQSDIDLMEAFGRKDD